jgi:tRNA threonylcarbamoyladenosine modification (KEOPS) complex Cgi121 subunit
MRVMKRIKFGEHHMNKQIKFHLYLFDIVAVQVHLHVQDSRALLQFQTNQPNLIQFNTEICNRAWGGRKHRGGLDAYIDLGLTIVVFFIIAVSTIDLGLPNAMFVVVMASARDFASRGT